MFNIKWMYSFIQDEVLYEEVIEEMADPYRIASLFCDRHVSFILVNEILYGLRFDGSWSNNYLGNIEEYMMTAANLYKSEEISGFFDYKEEYDY